jgi:hypothetical protein
MSAALVLDHTAPCKQQHLGFKTVLALGFDLYTLRRTVGRRLLRLSGNTKCAAELLQVLLVESMPAYLANGSLQQQTKRLSAASAVMLCMPESSRQIDCPCTMACV